MSGGKISCMSGGGISCMRTYWYLCHKDSKSIYCMPHERRGFCYMSGQGFRYMSGGGICYMTSEGFCCISGGGFCQLVHARLPYHEKAKAKEKMKVTFK